MKKIILALWLALLANFGANAFPVTPGNSYLLDFEFKFPPLVAGDPTPPYDGMLLTMTLSAGTVDIEVFSGVGKSGTSILTDNTGGILGADLAFFVSDPDAVLDGFFSILISNASEALTLSAFANGTGTGQGRDITADVPGVLSTSVPEPGTLALLGIAMAGLGYSRSRSKKS